MSDDVDYRLAEAKRRHGRVLALLWHQEVFTVAWAYQRLRPHTLASAGNFGRIITHMLERLGFLVFRGGSSTGSARRRTVLPAMVRHMRESSDEVLYGITVDGSNGPAWVMKPGGALIARACRAPVYVIRTASSSAIELATWDRTTIPLPFGRIAVRIAGPYWIEPDADGAQLERFRAHVEAELLDLTWAMARELDSRAPIPAGFPEGWRPRWPADAAHTPSSRGIPLGPHDLRPSDPPPWASRPGPQEDDGPARRAARREARGVA